MPLHPRRPHVPHRPHRLIAPAGLFAALTGLALAASASAQVQFTYQGRLTVQGAPANGVYDFVFHLLDQPAGGAASLAPPVCSPAVQVADGYFTVQLDFDGAFSPQGTYLEVLVAPASPDPCNGPGGFTTLSPRQEILPSAYAGDAARFGGQDPAFYLNAANLTGTIPSSQFSGTYAQAVNLSNPANVLIGSGGGITNLDASRISSGTLDDARLTAHVAMLGSAQTFVGVKTFAAAPAFSAATPFTVTGTGLVTNLNADTVDGRHADAFVATAGGSIITTAPGVTGLTINSDLASAIDIDSNGRGPAIWIDRSPDAHGAGLHIQTRSNDDYGVSVAQLNTASSFPAFAGRRYAPGGNVIEAVSLATSGAGVAVSGQSAGAGGFGGSFSGATGLHAVGNGNDAILAETNSNNRSGLYGVNGITSGVGYGVYGQCLSASGYGLFAHGRTGASGTKSFRIDHPADPTGKYLLHYSAESPEVLNLYRGSVFLDGAGEATILLPDYFAAINTSPSYQLTPVGAAMPGLFVNREIDEAALAAGATAQPGQPIPACSFTIAGGVPGAKVCWTVQAQRADRFVQTYGAPVETAKEGAEAGTYQQPELYGQPAARGTGALHQRPTPPAQPTAR